MEITRKTLLTAIACVLISVSFSVGSTSISAKIEVTDGRQEFVMSDGYRTSMIHQCSAPLNYDMFANVGLHFQSSAFIKLGPGVELNDAKKKEIKDRIRYMLSQDPKVYVLFGLGVNPTAEWAKANPEHMAKQESGGNGFPSFGSLRYQGELLANLKVLTAYLREIPEGGRVVGFHLTAGGDGQFFFGKPNFYELDYSPGNCEDFRVWLREVYSDDVESLRAAWGDRSADFENATLVKDSDVFLVEGTYLRQDVGAERRIMDSLHFQRGVCLPRLIKACGRVLRNGMTKPVIITAWRPDASMGHLLNIYGTSEIFHGTDRIYAMAATAQYGKSRNWGASGQMDALWSSMGLYGQSRIAEWDHRPFGITSWSGDEENWPESEQEYHMQIRREVGKAAARGYCGWFYEMGNWFTAGTPQAKVIKEAADIMNWSRRPVVDGHKTEMAVFVDEDAGTRKAWSMKINWSQWSSIYNHHRANQDTLNTCGVPFDYYFLEDIAHPNLPDYKVYILLHTGTLRKKQMDAIKRNVQKKGRTLVILENSPGSTPGIGSPDYSKHVKQLKKELETGPHKMLWVNSLDPKGLNAIAEDAGIQTHGTVGQDTCVGNGVAVVHRITDASTTVHFSRPVNLIDLDGKTVLAKGVKQWQPDIEVKRTAVVFYEYAAP